MTDDPIHLLRERFTIAIGEAFPGLPGPVDPLITASRMPQLADFQSNAAMPLAKQLNRPPRDIAKAILTKLDVADLAEPLSDASIAGPGFINVKLRSDTLARLLGALDSPRLGVEPTPHPDRIAIDLGGVNLAKQMHVGHLRSTVIPDAVSRTLERLGHTVIRQSHVGDWGLPIAMVTGKLRDEAKAGRINLDTVTLDQLEVLYRAAQRECERDTAGLEAARKYGLGPKALAETEEQVNGATEAYKRAADTLVRLQAKEPETYAIWQRIYRVTMTECLATCRRMHANITDEHTAGESSYADELAGIVEDCLTRGVAEISDGAVVIRVEGQEVPCMIRKRDGGFLYATTDMAAIRRRVQTLGARRVAYFVDARQALHFTLVFGAAIKAGYARLPDGTDAALEHAAFGTILGPDGRPFKTRSGDNVKLADLLDEAVDRALAAVNSRERSQDDEPLTDAERRRIAEVVGIAAIKYADLANDRIKDYVFDFDRMLAFEGNTGPYLLYALVRTRGVFRKAAGRALDSGWQSAPLRIEQPAEKTLALTLLRYPGTLHGVADALEPHRLCQYLYELATAYSSFYDACPILKAEDESIRRSRLRLCDLTARVLADGLGVLGIPTLERM